MPPTNSKLWNVIRRARDKLSAQFLDHPDVSLIDIGYAPVSQAESAEAVVLRIHVQEKWLKEKPEERVVFPEQMDGIPIIVMPGDYRFEIDGLEGAGA